MKKWVVVAFMALFMMAGVAMAEGDVKAAGQEYLSVDGWVYYRAFEKQDDVLYRVRPEGGKAEELKRQDHGFFYLWATNDWLYYTQAPEVSYDEYDFEVRRMRMDGSGDEFVDGLVNIWNLLVKDGELYVFSTHVNGKPDRAVLRYSVEPWKLIQKNDLPNTDTRHFFVEDGFIYCLESEHDCATGHFPDHQRFFRASIDGKRKMEMWFDPQNEGILGAWAVENGKLYYSFSDGKTGASELRAVNLDGTGDVLISDAQTETRLIYKGWAYGTPLVRSKGGGYVTAQGGTVRLNLNTGKAKVLSKKYESWYLRPTGDYFVYWKSVTNRNEAALLKLDCKAVRSLPKANGKKGGTK